MYSIGKTYKIEMKSKIFYTGKIVEEDSISLRVKTIRGEELVLNKDEIKQAKALNSIEGEINGE